MPALEKLIGPQRIAVAEGSAFSYIRSIGPVWSMIEDTFSHEAPEFSEAGLTAEEPHARFLNTDHSFLRMCRETVLSAVPQETLMHPYFRRLYDYDLENRTEYLPTLVSYLQHNCRVQETAAALYVHRNSLQYRIKKIEELLNIRIATCAERADMLFSSFFLTAPKTGKGGADVS